MRETDADIEIERKYVIDPTDKDFHAALRSSVGRLIVRQGYLNTDPKRVVRVRIVDDEQAWMTVKGPKSGISNVEIEFPIPILDAEKLYAISEARISKTRHLIPLECGRMAEVDVFNDTELVLAEVELAREDDIFTPPGWFGREVSSDPEFSNVSIGRRQDTLSRES